MDHGNGHAYNRDGQVYRPWELHEHHRIKGCEEQTRGIHGFGIIDSGRDASCNFQFAGAENYFCQ